jgi:hypothetical protein
MKMESLKASFSQEVREFDSNDRGQFQKRESSKV